MKYTGPLPKTVRLADSLAQRLYQLRELRNMTVRDLAKRTKFGIRRIEELESGLETWLSSADRQILAKALTIEPYLIEEVEQRYNQDPDISNKPIPENIRIDLAKSILEGTRDLRCPVCGARMRCTIQRGLDINEQPIELARANCTCCPFVL